MARTKYRTRFRKLDDLRFVSHLDLMRGFSRLFRRAGLRVCFTNGLNPMPRLVVAAPLPLGVEGTDEVLEVELQEPIDPVALIDWLNRHCPAGLAFVSAEPIPLKWTARVCRAVYRLPLPPDQLATAADACAALLAQAECPVERPRPTPRQVNIRPYLSALTVSGNALEMAIEATPTGSARPAEVLRLLALDGLLDAGAVLARTALELLPDPAAPAPAQEATTAEHARSHPVPTREGTT